MKKLLIACCLLLVVTIGEISAQSPTPSTSSGQAASPTAKPKTSPSPTPDTKISELKERIATRVAELKLVEKRGLLGTIATISGTKITIVDIQNRQRIIDTDELTDFSQTKGDERKLSNLSIGDSISAFGLYNKNSRILLARFVKNVQIYERLFGEIVDIDEKSFFITVREQYRGEQVSVSYEKTTLTSLLSQDAKLAKSGFSKIAVSHKIFVVGIREKDAEDGEKRYTTLRLIHFPASPAGGPTKIATPTSTPSEERVTPKPR